MHKISITNCTQSFVCTGDDSILRAGLRAGIGFPYECSVGSCGTCKIEILSGRVEDLWPDAPGLSKRDKAKNKYLACQTTARSDCLIKVRIYPETAPLVLPLKREAMLVKRSSVTHDMDEFHFRCLNPADFLPGQYALLDLPGVNGLRAYSMSNLPNKNGDWKFYIKNVPGGIGSKALFRSLVEGAKLLLDGPFGCAYLQKTKRDIVCVAGGAGLSPMLSIARSVLSGKDFSSSQLHFFYGARTPHDLCDKKKLFGFAHDLDRLSYYSAISSAEVSEESWAGHRGFIHELVQETLKDRLDKCEFYFAGPPLMVNALNRMLMIDYNIPFEQIHFDRFF